MNEDAIYSLCDLFNLRSGQPHSSPKGLNISISCPLALETHSDREDWNLSCSVLVDDTGPSLVRCFSWNCGFKGSLYKMLERAVRMRGSPDNLVAYLEKIEPTERFTLKATLARSKKKLAAEIATQRCIRIQAPDLDLMAEGRMDRYAIGVPRYALDRGLTIETCKAWKLGHDRERQRLVFSVRRWDGKLVGLSGRDITDKQQPKYYNYAGLDKQRYLYGEHMLEENKPIIVVEGQLDAILTWQHLGISCVAAMGEGFSQSHAMTLAAHRPPWVAIFPDNDAAGRLAAEKILYQLKGRFPLRLMIPPPGLDPGDLTKEQAEWALQNAITIRSKIDWSKVEEVVKRPRPITEP